LSDVQKRLVELDKRKEEIKKYYEDVSATMQELVKEVPVGSYFQDDEGIVYKVVVPDGKYVHFESLSYVRTKRPTEKRGDLSMKEAEEAGFTIAK
jgi:hypothetical protein